MDLVFYFRLYDSQNEPARSLAFYVANINTTWDEMYESVVFNRQKLAEQYGGRSSGLVRSYGVNLIGYASDIDAEQHDHVMAAWRHAFVSDFAGCEVSDMCDITNVDSATEIFERTQDAYQQQQAQKLRAKLSATITTTASPAAVKKI